MSTIQLIKKVLIGVSKIMYAIYPYYRHDHLRYWLRAIRSQWIQQGFREVGQSTHFLGIRQLRGENLISIGQCNSFQEGLTLTSCQNDEYPADIVIGSYCSFGAYNHITSYNHISIGDHCLTGKWVTITDNSHGHTDLVSLHIPPNSRPIISKGPVVIGHNVWIGDKATILPGVNIGDGAVIAANAVVAHDVPAYSVVAGIPAQVVKQA